VRATRLVDLSRGRYTHARDVSTIVKAIGTRPRLLTSRVRCVWNLGWVIVDSVAVDKTVGISGNNYVIVSPDVQSDQRCLVSIDEDASDIDCLWLNEHEPVHMEPSART